MAPVGPSKRRGPKGNKGSCHLLNSRAHAGDSRDEIEVPFASGEAELIAIRRGLAKLIVE